jgi:hypothetical protein
LRIRVSDLIILLSFLTS